MSIILPGQDPNDPMVQRAAEAAKRNQQVMAGVNNLKTQMFVSIYTQMAMAHAASDEELGLDSGRELAETASNVAEEVVGQYANFMFEKMGILKLEKVDKPSIVE